MLNVKSQLTKARALIADPEHWTQGAHAIENTGAEVAPDDPAAYAWCADGACLRIAGPPNYETKADPYHKMAAHLHASAMRLFPEIKAYRAFDGARFAYIHVNDGKLFAMDGNDVAPAECHAAILRIFDDAIAHAE